MEIKRENTDAKAGEHATSSPEQRELWSMAELDDPRLLEKKGDHDETTGIRELHGDELEKLRA